MIRSRTEIGPDDVLTITLNGVDYVVDWSTFQEISSIARDVVTQNRIYYVRTDGSDSNTGLANTAAGAFLTIQKAIDVVEGLDLNYDDDLQVTIQVADGTYDQQLFCGNLTNISDYEDPTAYPDSTLRKCVAVIGNEAAPANVVLKATSNPSLAGIINVTGPNARWRFSGFRPNNTVAFASDFYVNRQGYLVLGEISEKSEQSNTSAFISAFDRSVVQAMYNADVSIEGSKRRLLLAQGAAQIYFDVNSLTFVGTPAFSQNVVLSADAGYITMSPLSIVGTCTGVKYTCQFNSFFGTYGADAPGSVAGSVDASSSFHYGAAIPGHVPITALTAAQTLDGLQDGSLFTNAGTTALRVVTLPSAVARMRYTFAVLDADGIRVVAAAGDNIRIGAAVSAAAGNILSTTIGDVVELVAIDATTWLAVGGVNLAGWTVT